MSFLDTLDLAIETEENENITSESASKSLVIEKLLVEKMVTECQETTMSRNKISFTFMKQSDAQLAS